MLIRAEFREGAKADVLAANVATTAIVVNFIVDIVFCKRRWMYDEFGNSCQID